MHCFKLKSPLQSGFLSLRFFPIPFSVPGIHAGHFPSLWLLGLLSTVTILSLSLLLMTWQL